MKKNEIHIGLVDADLLCNGTRHPNLALLKIAGFLKENGFIRGDIDNQRSYKLITNESNFEELNKYSLFYISCVFSFTLENQPLVLTTLLNDRKLSKKVRIGGTGSYANLSIEEGFAEKREEDMHKLESDPFLKTLKNKTGAFGINMKIQMPDYSLYDDFISVMENVKSSSAYYKDYKEYSIGFLTRGCFRRCPFCVNKLERKAVPYSNLNDFLDSTLDEKTGKLKRPYIYLWDDNFLASPYWDKLLDQLIETKRPFQFRQGLDERMLAQSKRGEDMAKKLANANYHGDFIFAFDNWFDRKLIVKALKIWKFHCPKKETKFYLFCGFRQSKDNEKAFQQDIAEIFMRITVLMRYGCLGYIMRHEDYKLSPIPNIYIQIARWCNQPGFYRNLSFWEFCYKNQTYWEEHSLGIKHDRLKTYEEFLDDYNSGYYNQVKMTTPLKTLFDFINRFYQHKSLFLSFFNLSFKHMVNPTLWLRDIEVSLFKKKYTFNKDFWNCIKDNVENQQALIKAYYMHKGDDIIHSDERKCEILIDVLGKYSCQSILNIISDGFETFKIEKKDIPQFSDFEDAYFKVPFLLANCGIKEVDYQKMGFMLRDEKRGKIADKKYGENHMKTAHQLGLCNFAHCKGQVSALGNIFIKLSKEAQANILPKLCLYIPVIQNYFMEGATDDIRERFLSILSITTQNRRRSNVNTIIETVKAAM